MRNLVLSDRRQDLAKRAVVGDDEVDAAYLADAACLIGRNARQHGESADAARSARSAKWARIAVQRDTFSNDPDAAGRLNKVDKPAANLGEYADTRNLTVHCRFSVGCVATPTGTHPAASVNPTGGVMTHKAA